jgi:hypothetical protein
MGLRAAAHLPDQAYGFNGHEWSEKIILCASTEALPARTVYTNGVPAHRLLMRAARKQSRDREGAVVKSEE